MYSSFFSLGNFFPRYFIIFLTIVNGIDFLIFLSDYSLLVYRNVNDFCVLTLYPTTLLISLISFRNCLIVSLEFSMYSIGEGNGTPLQYSCLENPMDGGAWWTAVHGITKSRTWLSDLTFTFHSHALEKEMAMSSANSESFPLSFWSGLLSFLTLL